MRLHGHREPRLSHGQVGDGGGPNEVWSFGQPAYAAISAMLRLRERLRPYIHAHLREGERTGIPLLRPLLLAFPDDEAAWEVEDQYMFGPNILVAPITEFGARQRRVYLPAARTGRTPTPAAPGTRAGRTSRWTRRSTAYRCSSATTPTSGCRRECRLKRRRGPRTRETR